MELADGRREVAPEYDIRYTNDNGADVTLNLENNYLIRSVTGITEIPVSISTAQNLNQHGVTITSQKLNGRDITISGIAFLKEYEVKQQLINAFTPFTRGQLTLNQSYTIEVYVKTAPTISLKRRGADFQVTLTAPYPLFKSTQKVSGVFNKLTGGFYFPWNITKTYNFGKIETDTNITMTNAGHFETPYSMTLEANGQVTNPSITCVLSDGMTTRSLKIIGIMSEGEIIHIESNEDGITANSNTRGEVTGLISFDSDFFAIPVGEFRLIMVPTIAEQREYMEMELSYYPLYGGVIL